MKNLKIKVSNQSVKHFNDELLMEQKRKI